MAMNINKATSLEIASTVGMLEKLVAQYIDSGELESRFDVFDADKVEFGYGYETATVLAAEGKDSKQEEHGAYTPKVMDTFRSTVFGKQYPVTIETQKLYECVGNSAALQRYAAELTESLYQGWIRDKNRAVGAEATKLIAKRASSGMQIELTTDDAFAATVIATIKGKVEDIKEGLKGSEYGNTFIGDNEIAARDVVIVMGNDFAAFLDVHGFAKAFTPEYLNTSRVRRVTSNKIADGKVLITDARNLLVRDKYDELVTIQNSDGSRNMFYNKYQYIQAAICDDGGTYDGQVAFPFYVIEKSEV